MQFFFQKIKENNKTWTVLVMWYMLHKPACTTKILQNFWLTLEIFLSLQQHNKVTKSKMHPIFSFSFLKVFNDALFSALSKVVSFKQDVVFAFRVLTFDATSKSLLQREQSRSRPSKLLIYKIFLFYLWIYQKYFQFLIIKSSLGKTFKDSWMCFEAYTDRVWQKNLSDFKQSLVWCKWI